jgi:DNA-binding SARP family transcriptional activator
MSREAAVSYELHLLGCFALFVDQMPIEVAGREQRLLALLALRGPQTRAVLAGTLWPDSTDDRARASLRSSLMRLRRASEGLLDIVRSRVALGERIVTDVQRLTTYLDRVELRDPIVFEDSQLALRTLRAQHLLPGWYDDWLLDDREDLHHRQIRALEALARHTLEHGRPDLAVIFAEAAAMREPLLESIQAVMIRAHLMCGNPTAAIGEYRKYDRRLGRELGIRPSPALTTLVQSTGFAPRPGRMHTARL